MTNKPDDNGIPLAPPPKTPPAVPPVPKPTPPPPESAPPEPARQRVPTDVAPLFILLAAVVVIFPLLARQKPDHCPNDASRWNTVYFLVEYGTYKYGHDWERDQTLWWNEGTGQELDEIDPKLRNNAIKFGGLYYTVADGRFWGIAPFWSIDMVKTGDNYYSSKPPFLATYLAGVVWVLYQVTPWTFVDNPREIMRTTVILVQVVPFLILLWLLAVHIRRQSDSPFVRNFCIAAAALGTYLTPYLIPLNNHVIAACTAMFATWAAMRIWYGNQRQWYWFAIAGFFAAFTAALEVPAVVLAGLLFLLLLRKAPAKTLTFGLLFALIPAVTAIYTNYRVTGSVGDAFIPMPLRLDEEAGPYFYPGSYWHANAYCDGPNGIDALTEPKHIYLSHMLIGHHGFFLLTPIFILSLLGIGRHLRGGRLSGAALTSLVLLLVAAVLAGIFLFVPESELGDVGRALRGFGWFVPIGVLAVINLGMYAGSPDERRPLLAGFILVLSVMVVAGLTSETENYGGGCQGFRWLFWLIPLWLLMLPAGVELLARARLGRFICLILIAVSLVSVFWALPQVDDHQVKQNDATGVQRPFSNSWAHELFRDLPWESIEIDY